MDRGIVPVIRQERTGRRAGVNGPVLPGGNQSRCPPQHFHAQPARIQLQLRFQPIEDRPDIERVGMLRPVVAGHLRPQHQSAGLARRQFYGQRPGIEHTAGADEQGTFVERPSCTGVEEHQGPGRPPFARRTVHSQSRAERAGTIRQQKFQFAGRLDSEAPGVGSLARL